MEDENMINKKVLFIVLGVIFAILIGTSVYVNFLAKSSNGLTYILIGQILLGIVAAIATLFVGVNSFSNKKNYKLLFIAFLEILFALGLVTLNYVYGYNKIVEFSNYNEYMEYISMEMNLWVFAVFALIIGLLTLNLFIKDKMKSKNLQTL